MDPNRRIPEDGTLAWVTFNPDLYKDNNIMIIKVPENMRSPSEPFFQLATIDRSIPGDDFEGNRILDKLIPGLPKVTLFEDPRLEDDSSSSLSSNAGSDDDFSGNSIWKKLDPNVPTDTLLEETILEDDFSRTSISDKLYPSIPKDTLLEEPKPEDDSSSSLSSNAGSDDDFSGNSIRKKLDPSIPKDTLLEELKPEDDTLPPKKHFPKQIFLKSSQAGCSNAGDRSRPHYYREPRRQRSNRPNPNKFHPWVRRNKHSIPRKNSYIPTLSLIAECEPKNLVSSAINDNFVPHRENHPLSHEYPYNSGSFGNDPSPNYSGVFGNGLPPPNYPSSTGILGHHPPRFNPHRENHPLPQEHPHNPGIFGDVPPPNYFGTFGDVQPPNYSEGFGDVRNYFGGIGDVQPPNYSGGIGDVQPPNYSGRFSDIQPPNYSGSFGDVHPPPIYRSGTGILGHHPLNFNPAREYFRSCNPNVHGNHPLNNNAYQEVPRYARVNYGNLNPRDDANLHRSYQRKKDFRKMNLRKRGHPHAK